MFPGGVGLKPSVIAKPHLQRQLLLNRVEFRTDNIPRNVEELCRAQLLRDLLWYRSKWTTIGEGDEHFVGVDAGKLIEELDRDYLRLMKETPLGETAVGSLSEIKFDLDYLKGGNRVRHEFRFNHGLVEQSAADRQ